MTFLLIEVNLLSHWSKVMTHHFFSPNRKWYKSFEKDNRTITEHCKLTPVILIATGTFQMQNWTQDNLSLPVHCQITFILVYRIGSKRWRSFTETSMLWNSTFKFIWNEKMRELAYKWSKFIKMRSDIWVTGLTNRMMNDPLIVD